MQKTQITIEFEFGLVNDSHMYVEIENNNEIAVVTPQDNIWCSDITLPTLIKINVSGKNHNTDTIVDEDGNILQDKYAKINRIALDCFELHTIYLHQMITLNAVDGNKHTTCYFGFNGQVELDFNKTNVLEQYLACK